jgi:hypothetical protein
MSNLSALATATTHTLIRKELVATQAVTLRQIGGQDWDYTVERDYILPLLIHKLKVSIWTTAPKTLVLGAYPITWWQHFKRDCKPLWLRRWLGRWPVLCASSSVDIWKAALDIVVPPGRSVTQFAVYKH